MLGKISELDPQNLLKPLENKTHQHPTREVQLPYPGKEAQWNNHWEKGLWALAKDVGAVSQ